MAKAYDEIINFLSKKDDREETYRTLYNNEPDLFDVPIESWNDFVCEYKKRNERDTLCHDEPPTFIGTFLSESAWFDDDASQVAIVKNARYCPPFWHTLEFVKLIFVIRGSAKVYFRNEVVSQYRLCRGDICIVPNNTMNAMFSGGDDDIVINIIIRRSRLESILNNLLMEHNNISDFFWKLLYSRKKSSAMFLRPKVQNDMEFTVLDLCEEFFFQKEPNNLMIKSYLNLIFGKMLRYYERRAEGMPDMKGGELKELSNIIKYIKENSRDITLPKLAEHFGFSESYMSRYVKKETGESFTSILRRFRMQTGAAMLRNSGCSIEDIVEATGYTDASRFYRNFKEMYGMTPDNYRKSEWL